MAKREKAATSKTRGSANKSADSMVEVRVRLDGDVHAKIKEMAEHCGISISQLMSGIAEGVADRMVPGLPKKKGKIVKVEPRSKCLFFGRPSGEGVYTEEDFHEMHAQWVHRDNEDVPEPEAEAIIGSKKFGEDGDVWFILDYSGRPVRYAVESEE